MFFGLDHLFNNSDSDFDNDFEDDYGAGNENILSDTHLHLLKDSQAVDSDGDGWSNAVEESIGTNPFDVLSHPGLGGEIQNDLDISNGLIGNDKDHDGFSDDLEIQIGTDPLSSMIHPDVVMPHHFDSIDDGYKISDNLEGTFDIMH